MHQIRLSALDIRGKVVNQSLGTPGPSRLPTGPLKERSCRRNSRICSTCFVRLRHHHDL
ncbi:hypothetical protein DACRYDRAFT_21139 [Dacryopinax primogenitus]|uniref:Uncharacterized protein n=1 Tax=Dacryopinax primogenitus (strain DJM 731) TaxID=1858805 RepID=M5G5W5_DACPD|nr:uncharacterized protein DACRYDRAFT_21139 [Dacryopinax primogenitus]EJU03605.1 hypothetical protein DACRYDRAFT_21139 [Dacryopinax primogenitus]